MWIKYANCRYYKSRFAMKKGKIGGVVVKGSFYFIIYLFIISLMGDTVCHSFFEGYALGKVCLLLCVFMCF